MTPEQKDLLRLRVNQWKADPTPQKLQVIINMLNSLGYTRSFLDDYFPDEFADRETHEETDFEPYEINLAELNVPLQMRLEPQVYTQLNDLETDFKPFTFIQPETLEAKAFKQDEGYAPVSEVGEWVSWGYPRFQGQVRLDQFFKASVHIQSVKVEYREYWQDWRLVVKGAAFIDQIGKATVWEEGRTNPDTGALEEYTDLEFGRLNMSIGITRKTRDFADPPEVAYTQSAGYYVKDTYPLFDIDFYSEYNSIHVRTVFPYEGPQWGNPRSSEDGIFRFDTDETAFMFQPYLGGGNGEYEWVSDELGDGHSEFVGYLDAAIISGWTNSEMGFHTHIQGPGSGPSYDPDRYVPSESAPNPSTSKYVPTIVNGSFSGYGPSYDITPYLGYDSYKLPYMMLTDADAHDGHQITVSRGPFQQHYPDSIYIYRPQVVGFEYADGEPPETQPTPVPEEPVSGGCKASLDGPSGCNWILPPEKPLPKPGDRFPEPDGFPIDKFKQREFPPIDCQFPNFGNQSPCLPTPGTGGSTPGGYDSSGKPAGGGGSGGTSVHTGGPTTEAREKKTFDKKTCFPQGSSVMTTIMMLMVEMGISPVRIVFEIGFEWDKTFKRCWHKGQRKWDACVWLAEQIGCIIIDEGDGYVYIGPPFVKPGQRTHIFDEKVNLFAMERTASSQDAYYGVEVFGPNTGPEPVISFVEAPFDISPDNILRIEVGPNYSRAEAEQLAALRAGRMRQSLAGIQITVPYAPDVLPYEYYMRDKALVRSPLRGVQETYIIVAKASDLSLASGRFNILTGLLPATLEQMAKMPSIMDSGVSGTDMFPDLVA